MTSQRSSWVTSWSSLGFSVLWSRFEYPRPSLRVIWMGQYSSFCAAVFAMTWAGRSRVVVDVLGRVGPSRGRGHATEIT
jgi:hypothetical protein